MLQRRFNLLTSFQRPYNVVLTSCDGWVNYVVPERQIDLRQVYTIPQDAILAIMNCEHNELRVILSSNRPPILAVNGLGPWLVVLKACLIVSVSETR